MVSVEKSVECLLFARNASKANPPSQVSMTSAFAKYSVLSACESSMLYGTALLIAAMIIYSAKMQVHRLNAG